MWGVLLVMVGAVALDGLYAPWAAVGAGALVGLCLPLWQRAPLRLQPIEWLGGGLLMGGALLSLGRAVQPNMAVWGPLLPLSGLVGLLLGRLLVQRAAWDWLLAPLALLPAGLVLHGLWLLQTGEVHQSGRLAGALGYPIALGATGLVGLAVGAPLADARVGLKAAGLVDAGRLVALYFSGLAIFLSGSRGLWTATALTLFVLLAGRPHWWRLLLLPLLTAGSVGLWVAPLVAGRAPLQAALWCLGGGVFSFVTSRGGLWWGMVPTLLAAWATDGWAWLLGRTHLPGTESASIERLTFLRDAWTVVLHQPWGQGFRAWTAVQLTAASYPYWTGEVHSVLLDGLLNWGWLGGVGLVLLLGRLWWGAWALRRSADGRFALVVGVGGLALHGLVDWTLSYGLFAGLVAVGLGLVPSGGEDRLDGGVRCGRGTGDVGWTGAQPYSPALSRGALSRPAVALLGGLLAAATLLLGSGEWAASAARTALRQGAPARASAHAALARLVAPWHEEGWAVQGEALLATGQPQAALAALQRATQLAPLEPWYLGQLAEARFATGDEPGGLQAYQAMVEHQPWSLEAYDRALAVHLDHYLSATLRRDELGARLAQEGGRLLLRRLDEQRGRIPPNAPRQWREGDSATVRQARELFR